MDLISALQQNAVFFYLTVGIISLLIGSFLNAAIYRIPIMLENDWQADCRELLGHKNQNLEEQSKDKQQKFNLFVPRSQCPSCGHMITAIENIPVLSYLFLRGKCRSCSTPISIQYPLIEIFTALISLLVAWKFGPTKATIAALFFTWTLITLSIIDIKTMLLPDNLTLPLLWLGIAVNYFGIFTDLKSSVLGAMAGYLSLWSVYHLFKVLTGKEGMGFGDFKLLAAVGAWGGWQVLPFTIFASSLLGAIFGILLMIVKRSKDSHPLPFGPWLALAGFLAFIWRDEVLLYMRQYLLIG
jgi:leader peptidase (prepilin peptidase)/N-methyltransferase